MTKKPGRPALFGEAMINVTLGMPDDIRNWLFTQPKGANATLIDLVKEAMEKDREREQSAAFSLPA